MSPIYSRNKDIIKEAAALVMPGVGHFQTAMRFLIDNQLDIVLIHCYLNSAKIARDKNFLNHHCAIVV